MPIRLDQLVAKRSACRGPREAIRNGRIDLAGERSDEPGLAVESDAAVAFFPNRPKARKVAGGMKDHLEDRHLIIVDKPAGLLSVPTPDRECNTLRERTGRYLQLRYGGRPYLGVVHRLTRTPLGPWFSPALPSLRALQALFSPHHRTPVFGGGRGLAPPRRRQDRPTPRRRPRRPPSRRGPR